MPRYFALATVIVVVSLFLILGLGRRDAGTKAQVTYETGDGTPGPAQRDPRSHAPLPVTGPAPWALSALPECFRERSRRSGSPAFARARLPPEARLVRPPARFVVADCRLDVFADSAVVRRGENVLIIPPRARFYSVSGGLILDRRADAGEDVRVYAAADPGARFVPLKAAKP